MEGRGQWEWSEIGQKTEAGKSETGVRRYLATRRATGSVRSCDAPDGVRCGCEV